MSDATTDLRDRALAAERAGDTAAAARLFATATVQAPRDAALLNSAGSFHARHGRPVAALDHYDRALAAAPRHGESALNKGIILSTLGRHAEAAAWLRGQQGTLGHEPRYWSARAAAELELGDRNAAATSYDATLDLEPRHSRALHGRARVALERGEEDVVARYERAVEAIPGDAQAWLGLAQALDSVNRAAEARQLTQSLVAQASSWSDALELLASLRWDAGEGAAFCDHYRDATAANPDEAALYRSWMHMLAGADLAAAAAEVADEARVRFPNDPTLALAQAVHLGVAGDDVAAEALFAGLQLDTAERALHEARHRLRRHEFDRADILLARVIAEQPDAVGAWALRDLGWRLTGDKRHQWLHGRQELVRLMPLDLSAREHRDALVVLDALHDRSPTPVGQSVRHGTQTRGGLFDRTDAALLPLQQSIMAAVEAYRAGLPPADHTHPLLRYRAERWRLAGSWSIRLFEGGRHVEHIHSQGIASSAAYLTVPGGEEAGVLELGRSPPDLRLDLKPLATLRPRERHCALFPSTLYHGTQVFAAGKRMSVAFDVQVA